MARSVGVASGIMGLLFKRPSILFHSCGSGCTEIALALPSGKADEHRGMARVLDVEQMLRLYAVNNPEQDLVLKVTDDWIPENTGIYVIGKGDCVCDNAKQVVHGKLGE